MTVLAYIVVITLCVGPSLIYFFVTWKKGGEPLLKETDR